MRGRLDGPAFEDALRRLSEEISRPWRIWRLLSELWRFRITALGLVVATVATVVGIARSRDPRDLWVQVGPADDTLADLEIVLHERQINFVDGGVSDAARKKTVRVDSTLNRPVGRVLDELLPRLGLGYELKGDMFIVSEKKWRTGSSRLVVVMRQ